METGTNQHMSEVEPMDLDYITLGKHVEQEVESKGRWPRKCLHLGGVHIEEEMPTKETEMQEK